MNSDDEELQRKEVRHIRLEKPEGWGLGSECYRIRLWVLSTYDRSCESCALLLPLEISFAGTSEDGVTTHWLVESTEEESYAETLL